MQALTITTRTDDTLDLALRGEIDFTNAAPIGQAIHSAVGGARPTAVRVDIAEVTFLDSSGISVLVTAMRAAEQVQASYRVEHPNPKVLDQLRTAGLLEAFGLQQAAFDD